MRKYIRRHNLAAWGILGFFLVVCVYLSLCVSTWLPRQPSPMTSETYATGIVHVHSSRPTLENSVRKIKTDQQTGKHHSKKPMKNYHKDVEQNTKLTKTHQKKGKLNTQQIKNNTQGWKLTRSIVPVNKNLGAKPIVNLNLNGTSQLTNSSRLKAYQYHRRTLFFRNKVNCHLLFRNDSYEQNKTRQFLERERPKDGFQTIAPTDAKEMLRDCEYYKMIRNYHTKSGTAHEREFPLAYVITVHRDFEHVERLLRSIYRPQNVYCIHLDKKASGQLKEAMASLATCFPNVMLASRPQSVVYAHVSRLLADMACMQDVVSSGMSWRYLINMAATEFPLRTNLETAAILDTLKGVNDIHESYKRRIEKRWKVKYAIVKGVLKPTKISLSPAPHNITVTKGQAYNAYSRDFMVWALSDRRARDFLEWSKQTYSPDEHFWGSLNNLYHNPFLETPGGFYGNPDSKGYITKFISWQGNPVIRHRCYGQVVHNICVFSLQDIAMLPDQIHLAANKFDLTFDPVAYSCMEELIENKTLAGKPTIDIQFYKDLYFVRYKRKLPKDKT